MNALNIIDQLKQQLSQFGLNPAEWSISTQEHNSSYLKITQTHADLTLVGRICANSGAWLELNFEGLD